MPNIFSAKRMSKPAPLSRTKNSAHPASFFAAELNASVAVLGAELRGVAEQVLQHQSQQRRVAIGLKPGRDDELDRPRGLSDAHVVAQIVGQFACDLRQVDTLARQLAARHARQIKQRVDHRVHALAGGNDAAQVVAAQIVERLTAVAVVFEHDRRETIDNAQRRAQIVRYRMRKAVELASGVVELAHAPGELACALGEFALAAVDRCLQLGYPARVDVWRG